MALRPDLLPLLIGTGHNPALLQFSE
jgi:hypothetical protein